MAAQSTGSAKKNKRFSCQIVSIFKNQVAEQRGDAEDHPAGVSVCEERPQHEGSHRTGDEGTGL